VCGSRETGDPESARALVSKLLSSLPSDSTVIHGGAEGIDTWADSIAWALGLHVEQWPADWSMYGLRAGILRNLAMLDTKPDRVFAFWNGSSSGTRHTITEARRRGIPTEVIPIEPVSLEVA
jgi:hypothetical protein